MAACAVRLLAGVILTTTAHEQRHADDIDHGTRLYKSHPTFRLQEPLVLRKRYKCAAAPSHGQSIATRAWAALAE